MNFDILPPTLRWENEKLIIIDQTKLPNEYTEKTLHTREDVYLAIKKLEVRGAPAIGIAGAYGLCVCAQKYIDEAPNLFKEMVRKDAEFLNSSRPTAVNLSWAIKRVVNTLLKRSHKDSAEIYDTMVKEAVSIHQEDIEICKSIGRHGKSLIKNGSGVLTHCNAGSLATSHLGTATAPMYMAHADGVKFSVFADETRPLCQGSRLTSWELQRAGLDVTLICDDMAASVMASGKINLVIVGTDRVAANGDVANKIGTLGVAILAKYYAIPFYVACPSSTLDMKTAWGKDIEIEQREADEVCFFGEKRTAPENIKVLNPAFDVTPNYLVTGIITEKGIIYPPFDRTLPELIK
ncbi:MAG: S-methyl-5-thioribose-1-phosphate isomerase [Deferribacterales bacterium]